MLLEHMHKKFEVNRKKIKGGCQSGRKVVPHDSKSDLPLNFLWIYLFVVHVDLAKNGGRRIVHVNEATGRARRDVIKCQASLTIGFDTQIFRRYMGHFETLFDFDGRMVEQL